MRAPALFCMLASASAVTPIQQVVKMMQDLIVKAQAEKEQEEINMSSYMQWCTDTSDEKAAAVATAEEKMEELNADIAQNKVDIDRLTQEIAQHDSDIARWGTDIKAAATVREQESVDFAATQQDYSESLDAMQRAIATLRAKEADTKQALLQVASLRRVPQAQRKALVNFVQLPDFIDREAPEAHGYEFQSGGVVDMLQKLEDKFRRELTSLEKEEVSNKHAFENMSQELTGAINKAQSARDRKASNKAATQKAKAEAKGELAATTESRNDDRKYGADLNSMCNNKQRDFQARKKLRGEEIVALKKATEIISSGDVAGSGDKHLPTLLQRSLLQVHTGSAWRKETAQVLRQAALTQLAESAAKDPFKKVRKMVSDMVFNLKQEALREAEHHGWCQAELASNKEAREWHSGSVEKLTTEKEEYEAALAKLKQETADLTQEVADITQAVAEANETRTAEKAKNAQTVKDAIAAQKAVMQALTILREFYDKAKGASSLVQTSGPADDAPVSFDPEVFTGNQGSSGGVVGMVEVIHSDFARLEADTKASEKAAAAAHAKFVQDAKVDMAVKNATIDGNDEKSTRMGEELAQTIKDLTDSQQQLDASLKYYDELKPQCIKAAVSYEDRVKQREAEMQSLKEALEILNSQDIQM